MNGTATNQQPPELALRRLLKSCHEIVGGDNKGRADLKDWSSSPVFHHYVETLQEQLDDLKSAQRARTQSGGFEVYELQVAELARQLRPASMPAYALPLKRSMPEAAKQAQHMHSAAERQSRPLPPGKMAHRMERHSPHQSAAALDTETRQRLGTQDHLQDSMMDEMVGMAAALKQNVLGIESQVKRRGDLLEDTETALERSAAGAKQSNQKAQVAKQRGGRSFWATLMWLLLVGMVFVGMYIFIKVTSMAGYKYIKPKPLGDEL